ncbi:MAG: CPBP family glutamic-type intramembrane protease [Lachnospiraceae bacterium]
MIPLRNFPERLRGVSARSYIFPALFGASGAVFFNLLLAFSRLPELFPTVSTLEPTAAQSSVLLGALVTCLITPLIEELVFRGYGFFLLRRSLASPALPF